MKALRITRAIIPDDLSLSDVPAPIPGPRDVLISLKAAAINHRDLHLFSWDPDAPFTLGSDGAGVVAEAGPDAFVWTAGSEVIINPSFNWGPREDAYGPDWSILGWPRDGTLAEAIAVPAENVFPKPAHLTFEQAAALPLAGVTAYRALVPRAQLQPGERVLIHGIGGGVALLALQFALALGAKVMVTSTSDEKLGRAAAMGADYGVNSRHGDWVASAQEWSGATGVDVVVESLGGDMLANSLKTMRHGGRLVTFGATSDAHANIKVSLVYWHQLSILGATMGSPADFAGMLALVNAHRIEPVVDSVWPLAEGCRAFERLAHGEQFGKVVVRCAE
jgi:NADPH:quinone reductase-like Zn-dependent oxidoreductase